MASIPPPQTPKWLEDYQKRFDIITVVTLAYDPSVSDADVRKAVIKLGEKLGEAIGAVGGT